MFKVLALISEEWQEDLHPRDEGGRFVPKGQGGGSAPSRQRPERISPGPQKVEPQISPQPDSPAEKPAQSLKNPYLLYPELLDSSVFLQKARSIVSKLGMEREVQAVRQKLSTAIPTNSPVSAGGFIGEDGRYTPERQQIHEKILGNLFSPQRVAAATPKNGEAPTATVLGGRGGSGKSWLTEHGPVQKDRNIVIDADALMSELPGYEGWNAAMYHQEGKDLVARASNLAKDLGVNVVFDQTMAKPNSGKKIVDFFKDSKYDIHGYYMYLPSEIAAERALNRFKQGGSRGRFVPPEVVLSNTHNERYFDEVIPYMKRWAVYDNTPQGPYDRRGPRLVAGNE